MRVRHSGAWKVFVCLAVALFAPGMILPVAAQSFPTRPVKVIIPYSPGSPIDVVGRLIAQSLSEQLKQAVVVEDRPGAGGVLGTRDVATATPDGYTLLLSDCNNQMTAPAFYGNLTYDPLGSFVPVSSVAQSSWVMVTDISTPATSLTEFIAYAKAHPKQLTFGFGLATGPQLVGEFFKRATDTKIVSVPYKGGPQAVTDMLGGRINLIFGTVATLKPLIESGKIRALAVTGERRDPDLPSVPTLAESGFPELHLASLSVFSRL